MGVDFLPIAMGFFGISEILNIAMETYGVPEVKKIRFKDLYLNREEGRPSLWPILRGPRPLKRESSCW
jgi:putative tricarboxylic transport membrane protein